MGAGGRETTTSYMVVQLLLDKQVQLRCSVSKENPKTNKMLLMLKFPEK